MPDPDDTIPMPPVPPAEPSEFIERATAAARSMARSYAWFTSLEKED